MINNPVEAFLKQAIGLDSASIGMGVLQQMLQASLRRTGLQVSEYAQFLMHSSQEQTHLIESVVVMETWFFRNNASFEFLAKHLQPFQKHPLRLLSLPCATGEEPYSLAITLLEQGFQPDLLHIDAVDISQQALQIAQHACYQNIAFRDGYAKHIKPQFFQTIKQQSSLHDECVYHVKPEVQKCVHYQQGNLLDAHLFTEEAIFDVIFCRNLLIYLTPDACKTAICNLARWLKPTGLLFIGHAERNLACQMGFKQLSEAGVFACWHPQLEDEQKIPAAPLNTHLPKKPVPTTLPNPPKPALSNSLAHVSHTLDEAAYQALENAQNFANQGELDKALQHCQRFLKGQPDAPQGHFLCALIHQAWHDELQAERYFQQTLYLQPDHKQALHHLHILMQRQGRVEQAKSLHQRLQRLRGKPHAA